ncbi:hypothetical protein EWM64_g3444 [Hericium alpestre]|uniref:Cytochrome P450 n=1 Tax=Hericium alpestre TaxID=135208 RepID=A0A4Z0A0I1_9AGAM|nr:hypothetical protein EWM64_g3444 [Hericium alpestre]
MSFVTVSTTFLACMSLLVWMTRIGRREPGLPPGPPTTPLLGNILQFPKEYAHLKFTQWAKEYGGIFSLKVGRGTVIIISDPRIARDLLEHKGATTASRPPFYIGEVVTGGNSLILMQNTPTWRRVRRLAHNLLTKEQCAKHKPIQAAEATQVMYDFLKDPEHFSSHIGRYTNSVITSIMAGFRSPRKGGADVVDFFNFVHRWARLATPGAHPSIDLFPILKYMPERWAAWKMEAREVRSMQQKLYFGTLDRCAARIAEERQNGSFLEDIVKDLDKYGLDREMAALQRYLCGVMLEGGTETSSTFLLNFILLIMNYQEVQEKAWEEIGRVIGEDRSPVLDDWERLPYVQAIVKEVFRLRPPLPVAVPHYTTADESVESYFIPKDSTVIVNIWAMGHDADAFDDPEVFNPARFLTSEFGTKPGADDSGRRHDLHFGYGRRFCVGLHLANDAIRLNVMNYLWAFTFRRAINTKTNTPVPADIDNYHDGMVLCPQPFVCDIQPRNVERAQIIERDFAGARRVFEQFEQELGPEDAAFVRSLPGRF